MNDNVTRTPVDGQGRIASHISGRREMKSASNLSEADCNAIMMEENSDGVEMDFNELEIEKTLSELCKMCEKAMWNLDAAKKLVDGEPEIRSLREEISILKKHVTFLAEQILQIRSHHNHPAIISPLNASNHSRNASEKTTISVTHGEVQRTGADLCPLFSSSSSDSGLSELPADLLMEDLAGSPLSSSSSSPSSSSTSSGRAQQNNPDDEEDNGNVSPKYIGNESHRGAGSRKRIISQGRRRLLRQLVRYEQIYLFRLDALLRRSKSPKNGRWKEDRQHLETIRKSHEKLRSSLLKIENDSDNFQGVFKELDAFWHQKELIDAYLTLMNRHLVRSALADTGSPRVDLHAALLTDDAHLESVSKVLRHHVETLRTYLKGVADGMGGSDEYLNQVLKGFELLLANSVPFENGPASEDKIIAEKEVPKPEFKTDFVEWSRTVTTVEYLNRDKFRKEIRKPDVCETRRNTVVKQLPRSNTLPVFAPKSDRGTQYPSFSYFKRATVL